MSSAASSAAPVAGSKGAHGKLHVGTLRRADPVPEGEVSEQTQCWENADGTTFDTRIGPSYPRNKQKNSSKQCLYECVAIDIYITDTKISHVARLMDLPGDHLDDSENNGYLPRTFVVNCQIPNYPVENALWGQCAGDGQGYSLIFYFCLSEYGRAQVAKKGKLVSAADHSASDVFGVLPDIEGESASPRAKNRNVSSSVSAAAASSNSASSSTYYHKEDPSCFTSFDEPEDSSVRLLHNFVAADEGSELRQRFKGITRLMNTDSVGLGMATRKLINSYNGTPFLIRTCSVFWKGENYFEVDVDVHRFSYTARVGLGGVRERIKDCIFDFGFVIEGHSDFELPENMLGAVRFSKLDLSLAKVFPA